VLDVPDELVEDVETGLDERHLRPDRRLPRVVNRIPSMDLPRGVIVGRPVSNALSSGSQEYEWYAPSATSQI